MAAGAVNMYWDAGTGLEVSLAGLTIENTGGAGIPVTLKDIDTARITQAYAKLHSAYAGNDATGFDNDDTLVALLMQGIDPGPESFKRPWMLASKRTIVGMTERPATDGASLDQSVTTGRASVALQINCPVMPAGGMIIYTMEVMPERIHERMSDEFMLCTTFDDLPNPLRDIQRTVPVDLVPNRRIDAKHTAPTALYGYEPMNHKWKRDSVRLGGIFYEPVPGAVVTESRMGIWQSDVIDPTFTGIHHLAPVPFPNDVFSDSEMPSFEVVARHITMIAGNTQFGDVLVENNDDYEAVAESGV